MATLTQTTMWWAYLAAVLVVVLIVLTFPGGFFQPVELRSSAPRRNRPAST